MQHLTATAITWIIMIGLTMGWIVEELFHNSPMGLAGHLISGIIGSFFGGVVFTVLDLDGRFLFAAFVALVVTTLLNIYLLDLKKSHDPKHEDITIVRH